MLGILNDVGVEPTDVIAVVDVVGQYVFATLASVNHLAQQGNNTPEVPETGGESGITPEDFPHLSRAIAQAEYLGWDVVFDRGLGALVRGLVVDKREHQA